MKDIKLASFLLVIFISGCSSQPVMNLNDEYIPVSQTGDAPALERVQRAIITAAQRRGWSSRILSKGLIEARITIRSHRAVVEISYTEKTYSIYYKDSSNLDYIDGNIHRNYNRWVVKLSGTIQQELGVRTQSY